MRSGLECMPRSTGLKCLYMLFFIKNSVTLLLAKLDNTISSWITYLIAYSYYSWHQIYAKNVAGIRPIPKRPLWVSSAVSTASTNQKQASKPQNVDSRAQAINCP